MAVRVIDLFREWDTDGNGKVSRAEFHKAMEELKFNVPAEGIDNLFDEWDPDGSGMLEMNEIQSQLRRRVEIDAKLLRDDAVELRLNVVRHHADGRRVRRDRAARNNAGRSLEGSRAAEESDHGDDGDAVQHD